MIWATLSLETPRVMGILNLTPDSFSDGGRLATADQVLHAAEQMLADGADILDLGAESTRPGAADISEAEEWARLQAPLTALITTYPTAILSIDTRKPVIAARAIGMGARIWNDVTGLSHEPDSLETAARLDCPVVLMHHGAHFGGRAQPDVAAWLDTRAHAAIAAGVKPHHICLDPGIGFGKDTEDSVAALRGLNAVISLGYPVLAGASRKRFIAALDPQAENPMDRLGGSLAAHLWALHCGARIIRTHDVRETVQSLKVWGILSCSNGF